MSRTCEGTARGMEERSLDTSATSAAIEDLRLSMMDDDEERQARHVQPKNVISFIVSG